MRTLVVYESMFGNTRAVAEEIGAGLRAAGEVEVVAVGDIEPGTVDLVDLVVVGGPTHAWSLSRPNTRQAAAKQAAESEGEITLEPGGVGAGLREWLHALPPAQRRVAVFDTRIRAPRFLTGRASAKIVRNLRRTGAHLVAPSQSFLVTKHSHLVDGERERAHRWGAELATQLRTAVRPK